MVEPMNVLNGIAMVIGWMAVVVIGLFLLALIFLVPAIEYPAWALKQKLNQYDTDLENILREIVKDEIEKADFTNTSETGDSSG